MSAESGTTGGTNDTVGDNSRSRSGAGASLVPAVGIILLTAYMICFFCLLVYSLIQFWPSDAAAEDPVNVVFFGRKIASLNPKLHDIREIRLFLFVAISGALGSTVHVLR